MDQGLVFALKRYNHDKGNLDEYYADFRVGCKKSFINMKRGRNVFPNNKTILTNIMLIYHVYD